MKNKPKKTSKTRSQKRVAKTRRKLKKAALGVFSEKGVEAATVEDITDKADLGKGTLYRHFADKDEMVFTLIEDAIEHLIERLRSYPDEPQTLEDVLEHFLNAHYDFFAENSEEFILLFQGRLFLKLQSDTSEDLEEPYLRYLGEIESHVSQYVSPKIDPAKIRRLACAIAGFISGYFSFAMIGMDEDEIESSVKPLRKAFVRTLCTFLGRD
ncbi:MAG: TetR/AcrR family transcriptional regulator [Sedimentisphaerales bacterium]|nr:TetR/AcrR family transcriptional regulator [Sedimentisphaerales bacterium]